MSEDKTTTDESGGDDAANDDEDWTKSDLTKMSREELDDVAKGDFELDPGDYPNKAAAIAGILQAQRGEDAPEDRVDVKGRLEHSGRWIVKSQVRYLSKDGKPVNAKPFETDEYGQPVLDRKKQKLPNIIDDIPFATAKKLHRDGVLAPHLE